MALDKVGVEIPFPHVQLVAAEGVNVAALEVQDSQK